MTSWLPETHPSLPDRAGAPSQPNSETTEGADQRLDDSVSVQF